MINPYILDGNKSLLESFVCFADILGFSKQSLQAINNNQGNQFLDKIRNSLSIAYESVRPSGSFYQNSCEYFVKVFTDNVVIGFPLKSRLQDSGEDEFGSFLGILSDYQLILVLDGFFTRGAISFGKHYMDENIVFGDALIDAYSIETKGGPPRIVISPNMYEIIKEQFDFYYTPSSSPHYKDLLVDTDGSIFLNYLNLVTIAESEGIIFSDILLAHRNKIMENLNAYAKEPSVLQKYEWSANYHNFICNDIADKYEMFIGDVNNPDTYSDIDPEFSKKYELVQELRSLTINCPVRKISKIDVSDLS